MNNIEYYKSLISDEEVIKALIKESKAREGELAREKTRLRPNLNFFQRTVTNLVTSNKRVSTTQNLIYNETRRPLCKIRGKIKTADTLIKEIVTSNETDFTKPTTGKTEETEDNIKKDSTEDSVKTKCGGSKKLSKSADNLSHTEKTYREDLSRYFVCATDEKTNSKRTAHNWKPLFPAKSKSIVFNLNISKDSLTKPIKTSENGLKGGKQDLSIRESQSDDVISVSSSPSSSSECEII